MRQPLRHLPKAFVCLLLAMGTAHAQDVQFRDGAPPPPQSLPVERANPPAFAGPQELVGKSIDDLSKGRIGAAARDDIKALRRGPLLIHGNYCGIGNRPGTPPIDALDAACMRHDACTQTGNLPSCRCDDRLRTEATEVAQDPATPADVAALATATAASMKILICKEGPTETAPGQAQRDPGVGGRLTPTVDDPVNPAR